MNVTELFGSNVFNDEAMKNLLPKEVYLSLRRTIDTGRAPRFFHRERRRQRHEGLGGEQGRDALHPLVPAPHQPDGGKARQLYRAFG